MKKIILIILSFMIIGNCFGRAGPYIETRTEIQILRDNLTVELSNLKLEQKCLPEKLTQGCLSDDDGFCIRYGYECRKNGKKISLSEKEKNDIKNEVYIDYPLTPKEFFEKNKVIIISSSIIGIIILFGISFGIYKFLRKGKK